ncbi:MAG: VWA domain-containing protein [Kofleriaceae bacterium]
MRRSVVSVFTCAALAVLAAGCADRTMAQVTPTGDPVETKTIPVNPNRDLDLVFVVDNSGSMGDEQASLTANFPAFIDVLNTISGGLPNLRIGVISTNVGTRGVTIGGCSTPTSPDGDGGRLLTNGCAGLTAPFLEDLGLADGTRQRNYTGQLTDVFTCMAQLGTAGCGFEQPLEAIYRALQPGTNPGFLRPDAYLGIVIISDEDDCSAASDELFGDALASTTSPLGPRTSFRCFEHGVTCAGDPNPRAFGTKTGCVPKVGGRYLEDVQRYVDYLRGLKANPAKVVVAGILGDVDVAKIAVVGPDADDPTRPALYPSCSSPAGEAAPAIRTTTFLEQFPGRTSVTTICDANLTGALTDIAHLFKRSLDNACIYSELADRDPAVAGLQYECSVADVTDPTGPGRIETVIPECKYTGFAPPCWRFIADPAHCDDAPDARALEVVRSAAVPADTVVEVQCVVQPRP